MTPLLAGLDGFGVYSEAIGSVAAVLTTVAFAPQVIRTWRSGGAGLSWLMLSMLAAGVWLWFLYGLLRGSVPIMAANGLTGVQIVFLAGLKAWHARTGDSTVKEARRGAGSEGLRTAPGRPDESVFRTPGRR